MTSSSVFFDWDADGSKERTAWAGADDGLLVIDLDNDGQVTQSKELAFAEWTSEKDTDLQALAKVFDSNKDGTFDSRDARFSEFRIWKDANSRRYADFVDLLESFHTEQCLPAKEEILGEAQWNKLRLVIAHDPQVALDAGAKRDKRISEAMRPLWERLLIRWVKTSKEGNDMTNRFTPTPHVTVRSHMGTSSNSKFSSNRKSRNCWHWLKPPTQPIRPTV